MSAPNNRAQIVAAFNTHFLEFIRSVEEVFPDNTDISTARKTVGKIMAIMPGTLIKIFRDKFVNVYKAQLDAGDISFFINKDYAQKWPNITAKGPTPADADEWKDKPNKKEHLSEKPGSNA